MNKKTILTLVAAIFALAAFAQDLPVSNVYLLDIEKVDTLLLFKNPKLLTGFNPTGYNNQPSFLSNTELLLTVQKPSDSQTDIYLLDLEKKTKLRMTKTPESEYSPKTVPGNLYFSVVRVEMDEQRSQRIWQYPLDRGDKGRPVFRYLRGAGYYHWLDRFTLAIFNVAATNYLTIADTRDESSRQLAPNVGRCFQSSPNGRLVFVHKITDSNWVIKAMNKSTFQVKEIIKTLPGAEDFVILADGTILMGKGSRLYKFHPLQDKDWEEMADLKTIGISNITRMAASRDGKLAVVNGG
ncbi:MAG TPA: hypothetical protein ENJ95_21470 [Bacteroidetes bacterium]|nr:hypothetical protein [Bacteroidota bacterium]